VHVYGPSDVSLSIERRIRLLGGWRNGGARDLTIYTVPVRAGFGELESVLDALSVADSRVVLRERVRR
jgi:hypothetical protein